MARADDDLELRARARRAYERARLRAAVRSTWPLAVLLSICVLAGAPALPSLSIAAVHAVVVVVLLHRGGTAARAVTTGWLAGSLPLLTALVSCRVPHACTHGSCASFCMPACMAAATVAGIVIVRRTAGRGVATTAGAALVVALTASMGCVAVGLASALAALAGLLLVTTPALLLAASRRAP